MSPSAPAPLLALTPGNLCSTGGGLARVLGFGAWLDGIRRALAAGLPGVLVREPQLLDGDFAELLERVAELTRAADAWLGVHDRAHLVAASGAQGLHLGFRSLTPREARMVVGAGVSIGFSSHIGEDPACAEGADYRSLSPVYETPSKLGLLEPMGVDALAAECARSELPIWALGGINPERVGAVRAAGAAGVLVRAALLGAADPQAASAALSKAWEGAA